MLNFLRVMTTNEVIQVKPPTNPMIAPGATQFQIAQANNDHNRNVKTFHSHLIMVEALQKLITDNIDKMFLMDIDIPASTVL